MAAGDRILPLYSVSGDPLYFKVDGNVYIEGEKGRDEFTSGKAKIDVLDVKEVDGEYQYTGGMIWDATKDSWDEESLRDVTSWHRVSIQKDSAFKDCVNLVCFTAKDIPVLDTESTDSFFENCELFDCSLEKWNFSKILSSAKMFDGCVNLSEKNFHNSLLRMHLDKNEAIDVDNPQYIGADGVKIYNQITKNLIDDMALVGQIVVNYEDHVGDSIPYNSVFEFSTKEYEYSGNLVV